MAEGVEPRALRSWVDRHIRGPSRHPQRGVRAQLGRGLIARLRCMCGCEAPERRSSVLELIDLALRVRAQFGELGDVLRGRPAFGRLERLPQRSHVVPVQLGDAIVRLAATDRRIVSAQRVAPESDELLGQWNVHLAVMPLEGFDVCRRVLPEDDEPNHGLPLFRSIRAGTDWCVLASGHSPGSIALYQHVERHLRKRARDICSWFQGLTIAIERKTPHMGNHDLRSRRKDLYDLEARRRSTDPSWFQTD